MCHQRAAGTGVDSDALRNPIMDLRTLLHVTRHLPVTNRHAHPAGPCKTLIRNDFSMLLKL